MFLRPPPSLPWSLAARTRFNESASLGAAFGNYSIGRSSPGSWASLRLARKRSEIRAIAGFYVEIEGSMPVNALMRATTRVAQQKAKASLGADRTAY